MKNAHRNKIAAALLLAAIAAPGMADTGTANVVVSATVVNTCAIGNGTMSSGASSISIICTNGANATISAGDGANLDADAGRTPVLNGVGTIDHTGAGPATTTTTIIGRIPGAALQAAVKGEYTDTVNLTITYTP